MTEVRKDEPDEVNFLEMENFSVLQKNLKFYFYCSKDRWLLN
jgi:hypothetical protein